MNRPTISIKIGKRKIEVFAIHRHDLVLVPVVKNGACLLDEDGDPVLRWVRTQKPFTLGWLTRLEFGLLPKIDKLTVATVGFLVYAVFALICKAFSS